MVYIRSDIVTVLGNTLLAGVVALAPAHASDAVFADRVAASLTALQRSGDPIIRELSLAVAQSPADITIRAITDDRWTWHSDGDRTRAHTEPADHRPKSAGREKPAAAIVFVPPEAVDQRSSRWKDGTLVHELVHALDLSSGRYDRDVTVRERRAVFMQNVWRAHLGRKLRADYHGQFATLDYQEAARQGSVGQIARYIFTRSDFPPPR
jgi:hypothetical protein